jgi:UDP:flavonoid glycosyltransferase YjiC (YdhE family)
MVLIPWGRDQPGVAARAKALGVAEVVPRTDATAATIGAAIKRVMANTAMRRTAGGHSARLKASNPPATAAVLIESLVEAAKPGDRVSG